MLLGARETDNDTVFLDLIRDILKQMLGCFSLRTDFFFFFLIFHPFLAILSEEIIEANKDSVALILMMLSTNFVSIDAEILIRSIF